MEQLCWKCSKCTNSRLCTWVKCFMYPDGVKLDGENNIVYCPQFVRDNKYYTKEITNLFGISERTFYRFKYTYIRLYKEYRNIENLPKINTLCVFFNKSKQKIIENHEFYLKKYLTNSGKSV